MKRLRAIFENTNNPLQTFKQHYIDFSQKYREWTYNIRKVSNAIKKHMEHIGYDVGEIQSKNTPLTTCSTFDINGKGLDSEISVAYDHSINKDVIITLEQDDIKTIIDKY